MKWFEAFMVWWVITLGVFAGLLLHSVVLELWFMFQYDGAYYLLD